MKRQPTCGFVPDAVTYQFIETHARRGGWGYRLIGQGQVVSNVIDCQINISRLTEEE